MDVVSDQLHKRSDASSNRFSRVSIRRCMLDYRGITFVCNFEVGQKVATARDCIYLYIYTLQTQHTGYQTLENKISIWRPDENWTMTAVCKALPFLLSHSVVRLKSGWKSCSTWNFGEREISRFDLWIFFKKEVSLCSNIEFETRDIDRLFSDIFVRTTITITSAKSFRKNRQYRNWNCYFVL